MSIKYGFFNSVNGDRVYDAEDLGRYLHGIISSGVYADSSDSLQVLANGDMTVTVQPGRAMLDCHYMENDAPLVLALEPAGTTARNDAVVMRLDLAERTCGIYVKTNVSASPGANYGTETNTQEWTLAYIYVDARTSAITQSAITDQRANTRLCGWVHGLLDQVDTSTLFAQWEAAYAETIAEMGEAAAGMAQEYRLWFTNLTDGDEINNLPVTTPLDAGRALVVNPGGTGYVMGDVPNPYTEDTEYPGCYRRTVNGETEWLNPPLVWAAKNNTYCVYRAYRTAERWSDYAADGAQKPVYVVGVDVLQVAAGAQSYAVQLPEGAKVVGFSGNFFDEKQGCHANPVVDVYSNGLYIAAYAQYEDGLLKVDYNVPDGGVDLVTAHFTIKYVI